MRRRIAVLLGGAVLATLVVTTLGPTVAEAAKFRTVTKTFRNTSGVDIPPNPTAPEDAFTLGNPYPSRLAVSGLDRARIKDVNVRLNNFNHSRTDDMDLLLVGPTGKTAIILSDAGGTPPGTGQTSSPTIDDEAPIFFPDESQVVTTSYKPTNYEVGTDDNFPGVAFNTNRLLSTFDGTNPTGRWKLFVSDDDARSWVGFIDGWQLQIKARVRS
jgi:subtilisin-like proprotein convertase family protein